MSEGSVLVSCTDGVATVTVNRPAVLNALNVQTISDLTSVFIDIQGNDGIRAVMLTGAGGRAFAAGADVGELARLEPRGARQVADDGHRLCNIIEGLNKPVVAVINGFALGGGCELAMACTIRIAADTARFGMPEISLGIIPGFGGTQRLPRLVGRGRALEMMLTGAQIGAGEAWRIGLVNRVVDPDGLTSEASQLASTLAAQSPSAVRALLEVVRHGLDMSFANASLLEASAFGLVYASEDAREGTTAFLEKRKPRFTGR